MKLKEQYTWMKHWDFILIDMLCLAFSFVLAYYLKFDEINIFETIEWGSLFIIICCMNFSIMVFESTYSGILKRRYYQQFRREIALIVSQVSIICMIFYAFKIGTFFSREMMFTMYFTYFVISQPLKYIRKKVLTGEFSRKASTIAKVNENAEALGLVDIDKRSNFQKNFSTSIKRIVDIIGGLVGCLCLIPLTVVIFILNKMNAEDDGPVFYVQERVGKNGKLFKMFKYRSMCIGADEKLEQFLAENEEIRKEYSIYRKLKNDPRVTRVGKFLRKTSLDEFPQFINVLLGDMSLIGPRPYLEREIEDMGPYYYIVIQHKPGITGLWQINGRSEVSFEERLEMDITYHKNNSFFSDMRILFKTVSYVLNKKGAI